MRSNLRLVRGERRSEIHRRLDELRLFERARTSDEVPPDAEDVARRLRRACGELGPAFAGFGLYLASRPDVVPARCCLELARIPLPPPLPIAVVRRELETVLGAGVVGEVDGRPSSRGLYHQSHRLSLADGRKARASLLRPEVPADLERDLDHLELLATALGELGVDAGEALTDFRRSLDTDLDLGYAADALDRLSHHVAATDLLAVAPVLGELGTPRVLVVEDPGGEDLQALGAAGLGAGRSHELARRICLVWLEQVLVGGLVPVEAEMVELADGRLCFVGGRYAELPAPSQPNLWAYIQATAAFHPDRAGTCLLRELERGPRAHERDFHLKLRQVVPFRDGSWSEHGDRVAEHLMVHWRIARETGYHLPAYLEGFYRGLFWLARTTSALAPEADSLRQAQEELRWLAAWLQFRQMIHPRQMADMLENNLANILELPEKIDRVLRLVEGNGETLTVRTEAREGRAERRLKNRRTVVAALGLVMMALALAAPRLAELGAASPGAVEPAAAAGFVVFGMLLLWLIGRAR